MWRRQLQLGAYLPQKLEDKMRKDKKLKVQLLG